jgi:hypothetical protein
MFEIAVAVVACLVGASLSVRLSFFALVPALSVVLVLVALGEVSRGETVWSTGATMLLAAICTQLGYFPGSVIWFMNGNRRGDLRNSAPSTPRDDGSMTRGSAALNG